MSEIQKKVLAQQPEIENIIGKRLLFDRIETAQMLNISPVTLFREMKAGRISYRRVGDKPLWTLEDIQEYIASRKRAAVAKAR
jgi:predicted site-specific integrase-resolvase